MYYILAIILAATLYYIQASYYEKHWYRNLDACISFNKTHVNIGETVQLTEEVRNAKRLPLPVLYVKFRTSKTFHFEDNDNVFISDHYHRNDIFSILGNQQISRTLQFRTTKRGYFETTYINLVANDLFMKHAYAVKLPNHASLYVYPATLKDQASFYQTSAIMGEIQKRDLFEDPLSFRGIREYTTSDNMRHINWKSSAKNQELMVNTYNSNQTTKVVILFNLDTNIMQRDTKLQEYMIRVVTTLLHSLNANGLATRLAINIEDPWNEQLICTDLGQGYEHLQSLLQLLSRLDLSKKLFSFTDFFTGPNSLFESKCNQTTYLIISNYRKESLLDAYNEKLTARHRMHFICPETLHLWTPTPGVSLWEVNTHEI